MTTTMTQLDAWLTGFAPAGQPIPHIEATLSFSTDDPFAVRLTIFGQRRWFFSYELLSEALEAGTSGVGAVRFDRVYASDLASSERADLVRLTLIYAPLSPGGREHKAATLMLRKAQLKSFLQAAGPLREGLADVVSNALNIELGRILEVSSGEH